MRRDRAVSRWLIHCADPLGPRRAPPSRPLVEAGQISEFVARAEYHGVLGAILQNFAPFGADAQSAGPVIQRARHEARKRHRVQRAFALMLQTQADAVMAEATGLPATVVKGPAFAQCIYPQPWLRPFTDIDILVAADALEALERTLMRRGYRFLEGGAVTRAWGHEQFQPTKFELHLDLVNSAKWRCQLRYEDIAELPQSSATHLIIAIIHGGCTHRFHRLQQVVDICQAARMVKSAEDEEAFANLAAKTNSKTLTAASLIFAGRLMADERCIQLAATVGGGRMAHLASRSLQAAAVTGGRSRFYPLARIERNVFRRLIAFGDRV